MGQRKLLLLCLSIALVFVNTNVIGSGEESSGQDSQANPPVKKWLVVMDDARIRAQGSVNSSQVNTASRSITVNEVKHIGQALLNRLSQPAKSLAEYPSNARTKPLIRRAYSRSFAGFSADLTIEQAQQLADMPKY